MARLLSDFMRKPKRIVQLSDKYSDKYKISRVKAIPLGSPKVIIMACKISDGDVEELSDLVSVKAEAQINAEPNTRGPANAYVLGRPKPITIGYNCIDSDNVICGLICAVQYYRVPDKYLPKPGKKSK
jgi:hypothetical protein